MNSTIKRYSAADVPEAGRPGFWVHAGDFNQAMELAANREAALQQRLNIADQHVSDLEVEVAKLRRGPCELIYGDELPNQGIPGTSFQRLNALANEGE